MSCRLLNQGNKENSIDIFSKTKNTVQKHKIEGENHQISLLCNFSKSYEVNMTEHLIGLICLQNKSLH